VNAILELHDVHANIGVSHILQGVTLTVPENLVTVVLGRNGVGKTTTLRSVLGLVRRTGRITFQGNDISRMQTHDIVRAGMSYVPEDRDVFRGLTVLENLKLAERKGKQHRYELVYDLFPELRQRGRQVAGTLSGGQQQMLSLGRGLLNDDPLILIDEPTKGLAPRVVREVVDVLDRARHVSTIVMVEQNLLAARRLAGHVVVMAEGRVVQEGDPEVLGDEARVRDLLGLSSEGTAHQQAPQTAHEGVTH
jgi:branched-chain amino acid transport system ATP-binding protein